MGAAAYGSEQITGAMHTAPERDGILAVCLEGEFDVANAGALRQQIDAALGTDRDLILDLSQTTFVDSSAIQVIFDAARLVDGGTQVIVLQLDTGPLVERALAIVSIEQVLPRARDREETVRLIQRARAGPIC